MVLVWFDTSISLKSFLYVWPIDVKGGGNDRLSTSNVDYRVNIC